MALVYHQRRSIVHSLADLNYVSSQLISVNDSRTATVIFDKDKPFVLSDVNFESNVAGDLSVNIIPPVNILEIANYSVANTQFVIKDVKRTVDSFTSSVTIPTLPAYMSSASSTTTSGAYTITTYTISGFRSKSDWDVAKNLVWNLASGREANAIWYLDLSIRYYEEALNQELSVDWSEYDKDHYYQVEMLASSSLSSSGDKRNVINVNAINSIATSYVAIGAEQVLFVQPIESFLSDTIIIDDYDFLSATLDSIGSISSSMVYANGVVNSTIDGIHSISSTINMFIGISTTIDSTETVSNVGLKYNKATVTSTADHIISSTSTTGIVRTLGIIPAVNIASTADLTSDISYSISTLSSDISSSFSDNVVLSAFSLLSSTINSSMPLAYNVVNLLRTTNYLEIGTTTTNGYKISDFYIDGIDFYIDWGQGSPVYYATSSSSTVITLNATVTGSRTIKIYGGNITNFSMKQQYGVPLQNLYYVMWGNSYTLENISIISPAYAPGSFEVPNFIPTTTRTVKIVSPYFNSTSISSWDTTNLTSIKFWDSTVSSQYNTTAFNQPIDSWNVSSITDMSNMFTSCNAFNKPINSWNVQNVTTMNGMFMSAFGFNQPLNNWWTKNCSNMGNMFYGASIFDQNLSSWDVHLIATKPTGFDTNTAATWITAEKPVWGTVGAH